MRPQAIPPLGAEHAAHHVAALIPALETLAAESARLHRGAALLAARLPLGARLLAAGNGGPSDEPGDRSPALRARPTRHYRLSYSAAASPLAGSSLW
ncbi:MAG: hypothetical protein ACRDRV_17210 [Pseudonocardiaceae bacterium]